MDSYRHDSAYTGNSGLASGNFKMLTPAEAATYRSWRRAVLAFYCSVLLLGGFAVLVSIPVRHQEVAQAMPPVNVP